MTGWKGLCLVGAGCAGVTAVLMSATGLERDSLTERAGIVPGGFDAGVDFWAAPAVRKFAE